MRQSRPICGTSLELFLEDVLGDEQADFRKLLLADYLYLNGRLAPLYGAHIPGEARFERSRRSPTSVRESSRIRI